MKGKKGGRKERKERERGEKQEGQKKIEGRKKENIIIEEGTHVNFKM